MWASSTPSRPISKRPGTWIRARWASKIKRPCGGHASRSASTRSSTDWTRPRRTFWLRSSSSRKRNGIEKSGKTWSDGLAMPGPRRPRRQNGKPKKPISSTIQNFNHSKNSTHSSIKHEIIPQMNKWWNGSSQVLHYHNEARKYDQQPGPRRRWLHVNLALERGTFRVYLGLIAFSLPLILSHYIAIFAELIGCFWTSAYSTVLFSITVNFSKGGVHKTDGLWWVIFQRGEYTKPMGFDGWFFKGGSTQNQWILMGDSSKGGVHKTDGLWCMIFQRGEYIKPMDIKNVTEFSM